MATKTKVYMGEENTSTPAYMFTPPEGTHYKGGIVVCTDIFGIEMENTHTKLQQLANNGYVVIMPDCLQNEPLTMEGLHTGKESLPDWLSTHNPEGEACQTALKQATMYMNNKFQSTHNNTFMVGVCYGGKAMLCAMGKSPMKEMIKGGVAAHGSFMQPEDFTNVTAPVQTIWAGKDTHFPFTPFNDGMNKMQKEREENGQPPVCGGNYQMNCIEEAVHGFWVQSAGDDPTAAKATNSMMKFFEQFAA